MLLDRGAPILSKTKVTDTLSWWDNPCTLFFFFFCMSHMFKGLAITFLFLGYLK